MLKTTKVTKPFVVVWIPNSLDINLESKKNFERKLGFDLYKNEEYQLKEFDTFEEADEFVDELWKIWGGDIMKYNISNLKDFAQEIKPVNFFEETISKIGDNKDNAIETKLKELIKPFIDKKHENYEPYELPLIVKNIEERGYKIGCIQDENYSTYYIKNKITKEMDYFLVKNKTDIKQKENVYTATNYISDIIRGIKD